MKKNSTAIWHGSSREGSGEITSQSKVLNKVAYTWSGRFDEDDAISPEELIASAHAACFSMKFSSLLTEAGYIPDEIETTATVTIEAGTITQSDLVVTVKVPEISRELLTENAEKAKNECPVSKALKAKITMELKVESTDYISS